jgi:hypothetical protein
MSHFSKLLKESKVVGSVDTKLEQVYTSYNGHLNSRDFGLKRSLPPKLSPKSPWIRLKSLDTPYRQVDYRSAAAETSLVQMWRQMEIGVKTARKNHAPPTLAPEPRPIRIEFSWFDEGSREAALSDSRVSGRSLINSAQSNPRAEKGRMKHIWQMHQSQFNQFLEVMRTRRQAFKEFLENKENNRRSAQLNGLSLSIHHDQGRSNLKSIWIVLFCRNVFHPMQIPTHQDQQLIYTSMHKETRIKSDET